MAPRRTQRGQTLPLVSLIIVTLMVAAALSVDIGSMAATNRRLQAVADLAALDGARELTGDACNALLPLPSNPTLKDQVTGAVVASAARNGFVVGGYKNLVVDLGMLTREDPITGVPYADGRPRFQEQLLCTALDFPNAVRVRAIDRTAFSFGSVIGQSGRVTRRQAISGNANRCLPPEICIQSDGSSLGTVRVGSKLASASGTVGPTEVKVLNRLLGPVIGGTLNLDAVSYKGLADGNVTFSRLRAALGLTAGSTDQALDTTITYRQLLQATLTALNADGSPSALAAATPLATILAQASAAGSMQMTLRDLISIAGSTGSGTDVADGSVKLMDIVRGGAIIADGDNFASLNLGVTDVAAIPGFNSATVKFGLIEGPKTAFGAPGLDAAGNYHTMAETSQVRVLVEVNLLLPVTGFIGLVAVKVPYYLNAGNARAYLESMQCNDDAIPDNVKIRGVTDAATTQLGAVADASLGSTTTVPVPGTATLVNIAGLVKVDTSSVVTASIPGNSGMTRTFTPSYTPSSPPQSVSSSTVTLPTLATGNLTVTTLGIGLSAAAISLDLVNGINAALPNLQSNLLTPLYRSIGVSYGGADLWAPPVQKCDPTSFSVNPNAPEASSPVLGG